MAVIGDYRYAGYLRDLVYAPDPDLRDGLDHIEFGPDDLAQWHVSDSRAATEWQATPASKVRTEEGVALRGEFESLRRIEKLSESDPSFWVPLTSKGVDDGRLPVDLGRYPVVEVTYRCLSGKARPAWVLHYDGGVHFDGLEPVPEWTTLARLVPFFGFPAQIKAITFRLFSVGRSTEAMEIRSIRFRAMSPGEAEAHHKYIAGLEATQAPRHYDLLDQVMPLGVFVNGGSAKRLIDMMEVASRDYWTMAFDDIARHSHNTVVMEGMAALSRGEWEEILDLAGAYGLRILATHEWDPREVEARGLGLVEEHIKPYANSDAILAWAIANEPPQHTFHAHMDMYSMIEEADPNHPLVAIMREPDGFPLFSRYLAATGLSHFRSNAPWDLTPLLQTHRSLSRGQQIWISGPGFIYATDTPKWSTCPELRLMLNLAFGNGARGWFTYAYHNDPIWLEGSCQRSLTGPFLTFSDIWAELGNRMARFGAMAPLILSASPCDDPVPGFDMTWMAHEHASRPDNLDPVFVQWFRGPECSLVYVISNDIVEMTSVNINVSGAFPAGLEIYDVTDFVRTRQWQPMPRQRHLEMFPGQGQLILVAEPKACDHLRDEVARAIGQDDLRQIQLNRNLTDVYDLDVSHVTDRVARARNESPMDAIVTLHEADSALINLIYTTPQISDPRSKLIQVSAGICGCDGGLCRLLGAGKVDMAHELGLKVLPLTRELNRLFVQLRRGNGPQIMDACDSLTERTIALLATIRDAM